MIALTREYRASDPDSEAFDQLTERFERLAARIFAEPLSASNLVDRALASQFSEQHEFSTAWFPDSTEVIDVHECGDGVIVAVLVLAGLPIDA
jgi:hypothetical protein